MPTSTVNLGLQKPTPNADKNVWGNLLNDNFDDLDDMLKDVANFGVRVGANVAPSGANTAEFLNIDNAHFLAMSIAGASHSAAGTQQIILEGTDDAGAFWAALNFFGYRRDFDNNTILHTLYNNEKPRITAPVDAADALHGALFIGGYGDGLYKSIFGSISNISKGETYDIIGRATSGALDGIRLRWTNGELFDSGNISVHTL